MYGLLQIFKTPELTAEITLQPIKALPVDAAIIFADILLPLEGMGISIEFAEGEGPVIHNPVRNHSDAEALRIAHPEEALDYVLRSLQLVRAELDGQVPLIGFAGAPFTLASYMIEGGASRNYLLTKKVMYGERETWDLLMGKLTKTLTAYLLAQAQAGAQVVQLFDSWVSCLGPADYRDYVLPHTRQLFQKLRQAGIPSAISGLQPEICCRSCARRAAMSWELTGVFRWTSHGSVSVREWEFRGIWTPSRSWRPGRC